MRFASISGWFQGIAVLLMAVACLVAAFGIYSATDMPVLALLPLPLLAVSMPGAGVAALPGTVLCVVYSHAFGASGTLVLALSLALCLPVMVCALARRAWPEWLPATPAWTVRLRTPLVMAAAALLVMSMHRAFPLCPMLVHAGAYAAAATSLPRPAAAARMAWRTAAGNALLVLISTGLALAAAEIVLRIGSGEPRPAQVQVHPERIWTPAPHGVRVKAFEDPVLGRVYVEAPCGAQGLRERDYGPKPPGVCRILLVGDSFTFGDGLEWEQTYGRLLERRLNDAAGAPHFEVVNAGVAGYGPAQELSLLREIGFALDPDIVLFQMLLDNDISDDLSLAGKHLDAYNGTRFVDRLVRIQGNQRLLRMHQSLRQRSALYSFLWRTNPDFGILFFLTNWRFSPWNRPSLPPSADRPWYLEALLREWPPILDEGWGLCKENVRAMRRECEARGVGFAAYAAPSSNSISDTIWQNTLPKPEDRARYERGKEVRVAEAFFDAEGIPYASLLEPLRAHAGDDYLYYAWDGHFTPRGAEITAQVLFDFLWPRLSEWCAE